MLADLDRVAAGVRKVVDLRMREVTLLVVDRARQVDPGGDVASEPTVLDRHVEDQREYAVDLAHRRW
nr:hypothetical protein [Aeromicrobium sp. 9AM]